MANPITTLAGNVIATFQDRDAVLLYVVTEHPDGAALTMSDLATLEELSVATGSLEDMMVRFIATMNAATMKVRIGAVR